VGVGRAFRGRLLNLGHEGHEGEKQGHEEQQELCQEHGARVPTQKSFFRVVLRALVFPLRDLRGLTDRFSAQ
jgi:hypothetical protein